MMIVMQEQGPVRSGPTSGQNSTTQNGASSNNNGRNFGPGGGMPPPDESFGGGPSFGGQGQNLSAEQIATAQAARQAAGGDMVPAPLLNAVIEYLQKKAASSSVPE